MPRALVAIGSNLGEREALLNQAVKLLTSTAGVQLIKTSSLLETAPVGGPACQRTYLNGAVLVDTALSPIELLKLLLEIEDKLGRTRTERWGPRTVDLDLLLYDNVVCNTAKLTLPHPRMALRRFVLEPAAQIAAEMVHPTTGSTIGQLLERVTMRGPLAITSIENARSWLMNERQNGKCIGIVPTMGALHAGHLSLVERSRRECDATVVTIFINPKQFSPNEDFSRYPRQLEKDLELLAQGGADIVFAPSVGEMYPTGFATSIQVGGLSDRWEGASRPGHFAGVTTVVAKLLNIFPSDKAYFGQKDYQQYLLIRRMAIDLNLLTEIVACPIVREPDGLAMSSRNAYLSADDRRRALALYRGLQAGKSLFYAGEVKTSLIQAAVTDEITRDLGVKLDYATVVDAETLEEVEIIERPAVILIAAKVGATRLIDNALLTPSSDE